MNKWTDIINVIKGSDDIVIMTHTNMDGDAIGSASALCHALRKLGKRCVILLEDDIPGYLKFMHNHEHAQDLPFFVYEMPYKPQLAIVVDCGDASRIEKRLDVYKESKVTICIDHHMQHDAFADYAVVNHDEAATGLLVYELIKELGVAIDKEIAEDIYVAIITDTGCFKYSNTTADCHKVCAELYEYGIDHDKIATLIYDDLPMEQIKLEALAVSKMEIFAGGKAVISALTNEQIKSVGARYEHTNTCIDVLRKVGGPEIAAFIKQHDDGSYKLSLRAKHYADVNAVSRALGGGGHVRAAGATLRMSLEEAIKQTKEQIEIELSRY